MPVRAVTTRFMYKGLCTIPDVLSLRSPVILPEDEVEGESLDCVFHFFFISYLNPKSHNINPIPIQNLGELLRFPFSPFERIIELLFSKVNLSRSLYIFGSGLNFY